MALFLGERSLGVFEGKPMLSEDYRSEEITWKFSTDREVSLSGKELSHSLIEDQAASSVIPYSLAPVEVKL